MFPHADEGGAPRHLLLRILKGHDADRAAVIPLAGSWIAHHSDLPVQEIMAKGDILAEAQIEVQGRVGYDAVYAYFDALFIAEAFGCRVELKGGGGPSVVEELTLGTDWAGSLSLPDPRRSGRLPEILKATSLLAARVGERLPVLGLFEGPFTSASRLVGATALMLGLMDDPEEARAFVAKVADFLVQFGLALAEAGADAVIMPDPVSSMAMISPEQCAEFALPFSSRVIDALPIPVILHVCGDTGPILRSMGQAGAALLSLDQCMNLKWARETLGWTVGLGGNVDPIGVMERGSPGDVLREARRAIAEGGPQRFCLMAGCAIPPPTPVENVRALVEAVGTAS